MREWIVGGIVGMLIVVLWYVYWVRPHDEFLANVMICMDGDLSEVAYERCAEIVRLTRN